MARSRGLPAAASQFRAYTATHPRRLDAFHSQLESTPDAAAILAAPSKKPAAVANPQTLTEKIVQRYSVGLPPGKKVKSGDYVTIAPHHCMTHDNSAAVMIKFDSLGASAIADKDQVVFTLDHDIQSKTPANLNKYKKIGEFAEKHGITAYPAGRGIGHQIMIEEGTGMVVVVG